MFDTVFNRWIWSRQQGVKRNAYIYRWDRADLSWNNFSNMSQPDNSIDISKIADN